jgi:hypothetical protein
MTLVPPGAQLGEFRDLHPLQLSVFRPSLYSTLIYPLSFRRALLMTASVDLPPPPPSADPREPSPAVHRGRGASTPRKVHSPQPSRGTSPVRPTAHRAPSSDAAARDHMSPPKASSPPLLAPTPRSLRAGSVGVPIPHSLSRPVSPSASIVSSSSAIFERDIELPPVASLTLNPNSTQSHTLSHKSSRLSHLSHGSNLDHTVPAVLDDAVEALSAGTSRGLEGLEIESPAPTGSAMARQPSAQAHIGASGRKSSMSPAGGPLSRSPSPMSIPGSRSPVVSPTRSPPILGQISTSNPVGGTISPIDNSPSSIFDTGNVPRPSLPGRMSTGPQVPGAWSFSTGNNEDKEKERGRKEEDKASVAPSTAAIAEADIAPAGAATAIVTAGEESVFQKSVQCIVLIIRPLLLQTPCPAMRPSPVQPCHPISLPQRINVESRSYRTTISYSRSQQQSPTSEKSHQVNSHLIISQEQSVQVCLPTLWA